MENFVDLLEEVKRKQGLKNTLELGKFLGISQAHIYKIVDGRGVPGDENCVRIAEVTGYDPSYVIALAHKSASKRQEVTAAWDEILRCLSKGITGFFVAAAILLGNPGESAASLIARSVTDLNVNIYYQTLLRKLRRRYLRSLTLLLPDTTMV